MGTGSVGEVEVSTGTPCVAAEVASVANSVPPKKPFHVCAHGNSDQEKKRVEENMKIKIIFFFFFFLRMRKTKVYGRLVSKETYLQFRIIEHNRIKGRRILLMLRLQRKRGTRDRVKERSQQVCQFRPQRKVKRICSLEGQGKS